MSDQRRIYAESVWSAFQDKAATPSTRMMSSGEWRLLSKWIEGKVPLRFILRAIEEYAGRPRTLLAFEDAVNLEVKRCLRAMNL